MSDPKKFKHYYIICAHSKKANKIREQRLSTELERMKKPGSLIEAKERTKNFTTSLNESNTLNVDDWKPLLFLQHTETKRLPVEV
jgi:hypothetical protein